MKMAFFFSNSFSSVLLLSLVLVASAQRSPHNLHNKEIGHGELARQNNITRQILEAYLQKKLGLGQAPRAPSIMEILPVMGHRDLDNSSEEEVPELFPEDDGLQSVETEQLESIYDDDGTRKKKYASSTYENELDSLNYNQCSSCGSDDELGVTRWTMPLLKTGEKRYYLGIFFKANWFKAQQYCRFHGMHLASVSSQEENDKLEKYVKDSGYGREHFWTSGTDLAEEGNFFWMANGRPLTFVNWNAGEPNNFRYENGEEENCLELWNRDDKGLKWNDSPCSFETFFICEVRSD
ncbi:low affinity immunoglobulin epsilon Fc receptor isoform X1 [Plutella xylostella]|uniref:low affinity immunoglobulin epsilon Fc receptor isoform X1 n=1 Tax=Plutella xylostella TaxID=51655 RepID=UPI0005D068BE|nr:low affinity immunoglobulin epsilon Fc receptor isoform X1 [Plutella xylostella]